MQFVLDGDVYKIARITGPKHNFLGIRISSVDSEIEVVSLPVRCGDVARIDGRDVVAQVKAGLALVNQEMSKKYFISEVQFIPSDTISPNVYEFLTMELIRRIDSGEEFTEAR